VTTEILALGQSWVPGDLRALHRALVLRLLDERGPLPRAEIAEATGLSIPTAGSIVADLIRSRVLTEMGFQPRTHERGPRAILVGLAEEIRAVGVYIGIGRIGVGRSDLRGSIEERRTVRFDLSAAPEAVLDRAIAAAVPLVSGPDPVRCIGVAVPGPVDVRGHRTLVRSAPLGWRDLAIAERFEAAFGIPTRVEYNVDAMARAEYRYGRWRRPDTLLYLHLGVGVGFEYLVGGKPILHAAAGVSELGHHRVAQAGPRCACGVAGCLESLTNTGYLRARIAGTLGDGALPAKGSRHLLRTLCTAIDAGDRRAGAVLDEFADHLSTGIAAAVNMLSASRISLGGLLATAPAAAHERIRRFLDSKVSAVLREDLDVHPSPLRPHPGVLGAATSALEHQFFQPGPVSR
jgi:predicted NBD/HSP70 family sugar kinase